MCSDNETEKPLGGGNDFLHALEIGILGKTKTSLLIMWNHYTIIVWFIKSNGCGFDDYQEVAKSRCVAEFIGVEATVKYLHHLKD